MSKTSSCGGYPTGLTNIAMGTARPPQGSRLDLQTSAGIGRAQWLAHLAGYYSSAWLRSNMRVFDRQVAISVTAGDEVYTQLYDQTVSQYRHAAMTGNNATAIAFAERSLRSSAPVTARGLGPAVDVLKLGPAEVGMFGYDAAWLRHLLPPGPNSPTNAKPFSPSFFSRDPDVLLDARFALEAALPQPGGVSVPRGDVRTGHSRTNPRHDSRWPGC
ncbi:hypothetical protein M1C59_21460 [Gordonia terrae]|uniref:hypothetical protein n=1 Tax=Gordonia terrae TaxID=2055 RepID=UPI00200B18BE|nr:hypothetical protein [Gordonia terrae]UPW08580.1 hypothetical protein M1C59_21460 [Gordonia terrae]